MVNIDNCLEFLTNLLKNQIPDSAFHIVIEGQPVAALSVDKAFLKPVAKLLKENSLVPFTILSCLTGMDTRPLSNHIKLIYTLFSQFDNRLLNLTCLLELSPESNSRLQVDTVIDIWPAADWYEREIYEMLGVNFKGHPDLKNLLLPSDWEGFPLRKDYVPQNSWHGIPIVYDRN